MTKLSGNDLTHTSIPTAPPPIIQGSRPGDAAPSFEVALAPISLKFPVVYADLPQDTRSFPSCRNIPCSNAAHNASQGPTPCNIQTVYMEKLAPNF